MVVVWCVCVWCEGWVENWLGCGGWVGVAVVMHVCLGGGGVEAHGAAAAAVQVELMRTAHAAFPPTFTSFQPLKQSPEKIRDDSATAQAK